MKVFCKDCRHISFSLRALPSCTTGTESSKYLDSVRGLVKEDKNIRSIEYCYIRNYDFNCEWYKRKWWKFWINEEEQ